MDEVIFEEFKGTGNMELCTTGNYPTSEFILPLTSLLPARREDLLLDKDTMNKIGYFAITLLI